MRTKPSDLFVKTNKPKKKRCWKAFWIIWNAFRTNLEAATEAVVRMKGILNSLMQHSVLAWNKDFFEKAKKKSLLEHLKIIWCKSAANWGSRQGRRNYEQFETAVSIKPKSCSSKATERGQEKLTRTSETHLGHLKIVACVCLLPFNMSFECYKRLCAHLCKDTIPVGKNVVVEKVLKLQKI